MLGRENVNRISIVVLASLVVGCGSTNRGPTTPPKPPILDEQAAASALGNLGFRVDGTPVTAVSFLSAEDFMEREGVNDSALAHLRSFPKLRSLNLWSREFTSAGLENIADLTELREVKLE